MLVFAEFVRAVVEAVDFLVEGQFQPDGLSIEVIDCLPPPEFADPEPETDESPAPVELLPVEQLLVGLSPVDQLPVVQLLGEPVPSPNELVAGATADIWLCLPCRESMPQI